jgi:hypothetical protein
MMALSWVEGMLRDGLGRDIVLEGEAKNGVGGGRRRHQVLV